MSVFLKILPNPIGVKLRNGYNGNTRHAWFYSPVSW